MKHTIKYKSALVKVLSLLTLFYAKVVFATNTLPNQQSNIQTVKAQELISILKNIKTFSAKFEQKVITSKHETPQKSIGKMFTKKPNLFRWEVLEPDESLIIINNDKVWNYDKDLEQVTIQKLEKENMTNSAFFLSENTNALQENYNILSFNCKEAKLSTSKKCFKLVPKNENTPFQSLLLGFTNENLTGLVLNDQLDQTTIINFMEPKVNGDINSSLFTFKIPKNVDVVQNDY